MNDKDKKEVIFSRESLSDAIRAWNHSAISLMDIRHNLISPEEAIRGYRMPASTFVYTCGGRAEVSLNNTLYSVERFGLFHGGKGTELSIQPNSGWLEYYMVLYKAGEPAFHKREPERTNPFRQQYGFTPDNPIFFAEQLQKMYERWKGPTPLHLFFGKAAFYQLVYEIYEELDKGEILVFQPDTVTMAKRYIDEHYHEMVSIRAIASILGISESHLRRSFKSQYGESPKEYLVNIRLLSAKKLLKDRDIPIRLVASASGFPDEFNFSRSFMKSFGISPREYRAKTSNNMSDYIMDTSCRFPYNEERLVRLVKHYGEGVYSMFRNFNSKTVIAAALSLMLLLSACGTGTPADTGKASATPSQVTSTQTAEEKTRIVRTVMGDVEVPANPKRVAVAWYVGEVVSLGIVPVLYSGWADEITPFWEMIRDVPSQQKWDKEMVMSYEPDLIISWQKEDFEKYSAIAPVIVYEDWETNPVERTRFLGKVFGREEQAEAVISEYEKKLGEAKEKLTSGKFKDKTFSIFEDMGGASGARFETASRGGTLLYDALGLKYPDKLAGLIDKTGKGRGNISYEVLSEYFGDYILWFLYGEEDDARGMSEYQQTPMWETIPAVKNRNVLVVESKYTSIFYYTDLLSLISQMDYIVDGLSGLVSD